MGQQRVFPIRRANPKDSFTNADIQIVKSYLAANGSYADKVTKEARQLYPNCDKLSVVILCHFPAVVFQLMFIYTPLREDSDGTAS
jgi:hypothetical protein